MKSKLEIYNLKTYLDYDEIVKEIKTTHNISCNLLKRNITKNQKIIQFPKVLIVHLKRLVQDFYGNIQKSNIFV